MQADLKEILYKAEDQYLKKAEIEKFQAHTKSLAQRLTAYKIIRDREIEIFQPIAVELMRIYSAEEPKLLEKALQHWLATMRYCAMAMLLNNPEYLQQSILEWLGEMVQAHQMQTIESTIYELLFSSLKKTLDSSQFTLIQPYLTQSQAALLKQTTSMVGAQS